MKKLFLSIMSAAMVLSAAGCSFGGSAKQEGNVKIWWPGGNDASLAMMNEAKRLYEESHEGVTIEVIPKSTSDFYMAYNLALGGKDYPDIAYVDHVYVQNLMEDGSIANLSKLGFDDLKDKFIESTWTPNTYEGELFALPISTNVLVTAYNKTLLTKITGEEFTNDKLPKSYEEFSVLADKFIEYNQKNNLQNDDVVYPITLPAGAGHYSMAAMTFLSFTARHGGQIMSNDLRTMMLDSDACYAAANKLAEMGKKKYTTNVFSEASFENGTVGFIEIGPWKFQDYDRISKIKGIEFGYAPAMNLVENGNNASALGLFSMVVTDKSPNRAIAADFIKFVATNDELQLMYNKPLNLMPTTKSAIQDEFYQTERWQIFTKQLENTVARPGTPEWPTIETLLAELVTNLINQSVDSSELDAINYLIQEGLDELYGN